MKTLFFIFLLTPLILAETNDCTAFVSVLCPDLPQTPCNLVPFDELVPYFESEDFGLMKRGVQILLLSVEEQLSGCPQRNITRFLISLNNLSIEAAVNLKIHQRLLIIRESILNHRLKELGVQLVQLFIPLLPGWQEVIQKEGSLTTRKTVFFGSRPSYSYQKQYKNDNPFIFGDYGDNLWRFSNFSDHSAKTVCDMYQKQWLPAGQYLIIIDRELIELYDDIDYFEESSQPIWTQYFPLGENKFFTFSMNEHNKTQKTVQKLMAWSKKDKKFSIWDIPKVKTYFVQSGGGQLLSIMPLTIIHANTTTNFWGFAASFKSGRIELHSYTPGGNFSSKIIRPDLGAIVPEDNMIFSPGPFGESLLFLNTGSEVQYCDLFDIVVNSKNDCQWIKIPLPSNIQVNSMILTFDEKYGKEESLLIAYYSKKDQKLRFGSFRLIGKALDLQNFEDIQFEVDQFFFLKHDLVIQKKSSYFEGTNRYSLGVFDKNWPTSSQGCIYQSEPGKKRHTWKRKCEDNLVLGNAMELPTSHYDSSEPFVKDYHLHVFYTGSDGFGPLLSKEKDPSILLTTPHHGSSLFYKVAFTSFTDYFLHPVIQYPSWCFASVSAMIFNFYRRNQPNFKPLTQCDTASTIFKKDCCPLPRPLDCRHGGSAIDVLRAHNFTITFKRDFTFSRVKHEIDNNHLMTATRSSTHVLIILGYAQDPTPGYSGSDMVLVYNPSVLRSGRGFRFLSFSNFVSKGHQLASIGIVRDNLNK